MGQAAAEISRWLVRAGSLPLDFLLPHRCICCDRLIGEGGGVCGSCWKQIPFLERPWCARLGTPFSHDVGEEALSPRAIAEPPVFGRLRAVTFYDGPARDLVLGLKFGKRRELAGPMGRWMARVGSELLEDCLVVPVPLHWSRLWQRRFNQAGDLAKQVACASGNEFMPDLLKRSKRTRQQVGLAAKDRQKNVLRAFQVSGHGQSIVTGRAVVLVDDVFTTGSTAGACAKVLLEAGAASVDVLTFAHADITHTNDGSWTDF